MVLNYISQNTLVNFLETDTYMHKHVLNPFTNFTFLIGHSPHFSTDARIISLTNVPLRGSDEYIFEEIHFHIGKREEKGSEHSIDGDFYPMEVQ